MGTAIASWLRIAAVTFAAAALIGVTAPAAGAHTRLRHHATRHVKVHHRARTKRHVTNQSPALAPVRCPDADAPVTSASVDAMRAAVVCLINQQRNQRGLPSLAVSSQLNSSAQSWTNVMIATGDFTHGPGDAFANRIGNAGYDWQVAGENIAAGYDTPSAVVSAWMASTDHCRNILDPSFRDIGTGESTGAIGVNGPGSWTQDFGLLMSQSPLSSDTGPQSGCPY